MENSEKEIIKKLFKLKKYKEIANAESYIIKLERNGSKIILDRLFTKETVLITVSALYWSINDYKNYKKIKASILLKLPLNIDNREIIKILRDKIYEEVIKKAIMML